MTLKQSTSPGSFLKAVGIFVVASVLLLPLIVRADSLTPVRTADQIRQDQVSLYKKARLGLDDDGNVMVRYRGVSLTFIYEAGSNSLENRTQSSVSASRQEVACLGGFSVKLGLTF